MFVYAWAGGPVHSAIFEIPCLQAPGVQAPCLQTFMMLPFARATRLVPVLAQPCENNMKKYENNMKKYENNVIFNFHIIFTSYSYYFHIFITFWGSGGRSGPQKSYFLHIPGHICFILFPYFGICLGCAPVHTAIFETHALSLCSATSAQLAC